MTKDLVRNCMHVAIVATQEYGALLNKHFDKYALPILVTDISIEVYKSIEIKLPTLVPAEVHSLICKEFKRLIWERNHIVL